MLPTSGNWKVIVTKVSSVCFSFCPYLSCTATWLDITRDWAAPPTLNRVYHLCIMFGTCYYYDWFQTCWMRWEGMPESLWTVRWPLTLTFSLWYGDLHYRNSFDYYWYTLPLALSSRSDEGIDILARLPLGRERSATSLMLGNAYGSLSSIAMLCARSAERSRHE